MKNRSPFHIIKSRYVTEKTTVLLGLQHASSNKSVAKCSCPKYVFIVDQKANKVEIAQAIEAIYREKKVKVKAVNTLNVKPKQRRVRGYKGFRSGIKKAIVTFESGDSIEEVV